MKFIPLKQLTDELLKDEESKKIYAELEPEFLLIEKLIENRIKHGITQKELAKKMGTKQSAISRFESGNYNPTMEFLYKLADALGVKLKFTVS